MSSSFIIHHLHNHKPCHHCASKSATIFSINTSKIKSTKSIKIIQIGFTIKKYAIGLRMKLGIRNKIYPTGFIIPMMRLFESQCWVWKQMWFYRSQLWNIKLGRAPHVSRFMWKKTCSKYDHTASEQNSFFWECDFQTLWCYRLIFDQSLMIHLEIFGQWVSDAYKQRRLWTSILQRVWSDDDMVA